MAPTQNDPTPSPADEKRDPRPSDGGAVREPPVADRPRGDPPAEAPTKQAR